MHKLHKWAVTCGFLLLSILQTNAQERCGTMSRHKALLREDAQYRIQYEQGIELSKRSASREASTQGTVYKIPVVVHIMHLGENVGVGSNISDDQVYSAIYSLNNAYRKKAGTIYDGNGVDMEIEFCLAQKDPNGNATSGINRVNAVSVSNYGTMGITDANETTIKALKKWSNTRYYNIWVVSEIDGNDAGSGVQGYAYFAGASPAKDGAVMLYNAFGYDPQGTRNYNLKSYTNKNITCIHELGHAFNLYHTFEGDGDGNTCPPLVNGCGDGKGDCCDDIPAHKRSQSNCVSGTNDCFTPVSRELFIHNYMDYSSEGCQNMFTADQYALARTVLSPNGSRGLLANALNLAACGCSGNTAPIPRFYALTTKPCGNTPVQFIDESLNAPASYNWTFAGGTPAGSTNRNPITTYTGTGPYAVSLTVTSTGGKSSTATKTAYISPVAESTEALPFSENFAGLFPPKGWTVVSDDANTEWGTYGTKQWQKREVGGTGDGTDTTAAAINYYNYLTSIDGTDNLVMPIINLSGVSAPSLTFKVAYHNYSSNSSDTLKVLASTDCGATYSVLYNKGGATLETPLTSENLAPTLAGQWRTETVDLNAFADQRVQLVFSGVNRYGDNLFVDDVTIEGTTYSAPVADFTVSKSAGVFNEETVLFTNASTGQVNTYSWDFGVDAMPATANTIGPHNVSYSSNGSKTVSLTVTGPGGSNTVTKTDFVNVITSVISSSALENAGIKVYPNPTKDILYIDAANSQSVSAELLDVLSNTVIGAQVKTDGSRMEINLAAQPQGLYLLLIKTSQGNFGTRVMKMN